MVNVDDDADTVAERIADVERLRERVYAGTVSRVHRVQGLDGEWIHAPPIEGTLIVNVADLLARWTGGAYRSTPHRVVNASGRERLSLVVAYDPDPETLIDARQIFGDDLEAADEPITCGDYLLWRFGRAFAYRERGDSATP